MKTNANFKYREIAGAYYLIPTGNAAVKSADPIQLTETAAWIWRQIDGCSSPEYLAEKMIQEYDVDIAHAQMAIQAFLAQLSEQGLL